MWSRRTWNYWRFHIFCICYSVCYVACINLGSVAAPFTNTRTTVTLFTRATSKVLWQCVCACARARACMTESERKTGKEGANVNSRSYIQHKKPYYLCFTWEIDKGQQPTGKQIRQCECLKCHNKHLGKSQLHAEYKPTALSTFKPSKVSLHTCVQAVTNSWHRHDFCINSIWAHK
jgi:hypothetical protein